MDRVTNIEALILSGCLPLFNSSRIKDFIDLALAFAVIVGTSINRLIVTNSK
jgi:hypothetical protein